MALTLGEGVDLDSLAAGLVGLGATLGVNQMRRKDGVDEGRLAETGLAYLKWNGMECNKKITMSYFCFLMFLCACMLFFPSA